MNLLDEMMEIAGHCDNVATVEWLHTKLHVPIPALKWPSIFSWPFSTMKWAREHGAAFEKSTTGETCPSVLLSHSTSPEQFNWVHAQQGAPCSCTAKLKPGDREKFNQMLAAMAAEMLSAPKPAK